MTRLKTLCALFSLLTLAAAITGIQAVSTQPSGVTVTHFTFFGRVWAFALAVFLAAFGYGIHVRAKTAWKAGFILLVLSYVNFFVGAVTATYRLAEIKDVPSFWLPAAIGVLVSSAMTVYGTVWWKRQRAYFYGQHDLK